MKVIIETINHSAHRYPTVGDWWFDPDGALQIRVSEMGDERMSMCVAVHELVEVLLCKHRGITQEQVDRFDVKYEEERAQGLHGQMDEPGFDLGAPYRREHHIATVVEMLLAKEYNLDWNTYNNTVGNM